MVKKTLKINGMSCGHCVMHVSEALNRLDKVLKAKVKIGKAEIKAEEGLEDSELKDAIEKAGYELVSVE